MKELPKQPPSTPDDKVRSAPCAAKTYSKRHLTELLIKKARDIKMLPATAAKAIAMADDPEASIGQLANVIAEDVKLTTNILSLANSPVFPVYAAGKKVSCLRTAVTRLGLRQIKQMILVSCYSSMVNSLEWQEIRIREVLAQHNYLTAIISSELNKLFEMGMQGEEFTAGLLHDVGRILLAVTIPNEFGLLDRLDFKENQQTLDHEKQIIGTHHSEIGAWFLSRNQLTDELINVARYHHIPFEASRYNRLIALVATADDLANQYQRDELNGEYDCSQHDGPRLLEMLGVDDAIATINDHWRELLERSLQTYQQMTS